MAERSNKQITVSLSWDTYREIDRQREGTKLTRSAWVEKALRAYLAEVDEAEKERRDGLGEKIEEVLELVKYQSDRLSEEGKKNTDRQMKGLSKSRRAAERVYALVEGIYLPSEGREEAREAADDQAGKRIRIEEQRERGTDRQRTGAQGAARGSADETGPVEGKG